MKSRLRLSIFITALALALAPLSVCAKEEEFKLPKPRLKGQLSVEAALVAKKTVRSFSKKPLTLEQVSQILWSTNGNLPTDAVTGSTKKVIASAGALYPLEVFLLTGKETVGNVPAAVFQYDPMKHALKTVTTGDQRSHVAGAAFAQMWLAKAPALFIIAAVPTKTTVKYGQRGLRYIFMEVGAADQNIYLQAEALGLHAGTVGAFKDPLVAKAAKLPKNTMPALLVAVGN
jgi:SagB-type dehydrogenase family enzyme